MFQVSAYRAGERSFGYLCLAFSAMAVGTMLKGLVGVLVGENLTRIFHASNSPFFYLYSILADFFPWSLFLPCACLYLWTSRFERSSEEEALLRVWFIGFFLLLNLPAGKAERFLVYLIPPFALLMARYWDHLLRVAEYSYRRRDLVLASNRDRS